MITQVLAELDASRIFARVNKSPQSGAFKVCAHDFKVREELGFELSGEGEHLWLCLEKTQLTTLQVQNRLARWASLPKRAVSYSGLKDKHGQCTQWFSLHLPGKAAPAMDFIDAQLQLVSATRHHKKIRIGAHASNHFTIKLRQLADAAALSERLADIKHRGVPNYFGEQRFGILRNNLQQAAAYFARSRGVRSGRRKDAQRGLYLSAVRSYLFNILLSERVSQGTWNQYIDGDVLQLDGSQSVFVPEQWDAALAQRYASFDVHSSGPLFGASDIAYYGQAQRWIEQHLQPYQSWCDLLVELDLNMHFRTLRLVPRAFEYNINSNNDIELNFRLTKGSFATAIIRELISSSSDAHHQQL